MKSIARAKKILSLILAALLCAALFGCSEKSPVPEESARPEERAAEPEPIAEEPEETELRDRVPEELTYNGAAIRVFVSNGSGQLEQLYEGDEEKSGDVENDAIVQRNLVTMDRLDIDLEYIGDATAYWGNIGKILSNIVVSGDGTYDLFLGNEYGHVTLVTVGGLTNVNELDHLDWDMPWWNDNYMNELMIGRDNRLFLAGDYIIETVRMAHTLFFNKNFYTDAFGQPEELYDLVLDGTWTLDKLAKTAEAAFVDMNNNGQTDTDDRLGYITYLAGASVDPFAYLGDVPYSTHDEDGYIVLNLLNEQAVTLAEKTVSFFHQEGSVFQMNADVSGQVFKEGRALFLGLNSLGTAQYYRDMEDDYGFLPYPKLDENQEAYHSLVADNALIGSVPCTSQNLDKMGAVLEVLSYETWKTVIPAWYETALKIKYSRDNIAAQIIDIIHDSTTTNFVYAYSNLLSNAGQVIRTLVQTNSTDYASGVKRIERAAVKSLEKVIKSYEKNAVQPKG